LTDVTDNVTDNLTGVTDKELLVLKLILENNFYTTSEMAAKLAVSRQTIARRLKALQEKKLIRRVGSDRKGLWEVV
jgi:ATP-dependent DNA helicase RecG